MPLYHPAVVIVCPRMSEETPTYDRPTAGDPFDQRFGHLSEGARAAARVLDSLAKTSRAFRFYEPNNRAIQAFLAEMFERFDVYFARREKLTLKVRPDAFLWADTGEEVYHDEDRESGFPFRLYRDGIRVLILKQGLERDEILGLQKILAMRTLGRLDEEDIATQLWRARSEHVAFYQVRGLVEASKEILSLDGGEMEIEGAMAFAELTRLEMDADQRGQLAAMPSLLQGRWLDEWQPLRSPQDTALPAFRALGAEQLRPFQGGYAFDSAAVLCHVIVRCLDTSEADLPAAPSPEELVALLEDARFAHLIAGDVKPYRQVVKVLRNRIVEMSADNPWRTSIEAYLAEGGGRSTIRLLLGAVGRRAAIPEKILPLLKSMRNVEDGWLADSIGEAVDAEGRLAVAHLVVHLAWPDLARLVSIAGQCSGEALTALTRELTKYDRSQVLPLLIDLFPHALPEAQLLIGEVVLGQESREGMGQIARHALDSRSEEVRVLGLQLALRTDDARLQGSIDALVEPAELLASSPATAVETLRTWALMPGSHKMTQLIKWAQPPRVGLTRKKEDLRILYVHALGAIGTRKAEQALREIKDKGSPEFQGAVIEALQRIDEERRP